MSAFFTHDTDTNVGSLDHGYVVSTIANTADAFFSVFANEAGDVGFLCGGAATGYDTGEADGDRDEVVAEVVEEEGEGFAVNEETTSGV